MEDAFRLYNRFNGTEFMEQELELEWQNVGEGGNVTQEDAAEATELE
jgi:hypothetical protein